MTEEKRKNDTRTVAQILSDEMDRQFEEDPPKLPTLEEFRAMAYERLEQEGLLDTAEKEDLLENDGTKDLGREAVPTAACKRGSKKLLRRVGMAAGFIVAVLIGAFAISMFTEDVGADKNPKETIVTEDGVIIEDGGYGSSEEEDNVFIIEDWEYINDAKIVEPNIWIPSYIPNGYMFESLTIEKIVEEDSHSMYVFLNEKDEQILIEILIINTGEFAGQIHNSDRVLASSKGEIFIREDLEKKATTFLQGGATINIWGDVLDVEIIKIINGLSR